MRKISLVLTLFLTLMPYYVKASCKTISECYQEASEKLDRAQSRLKAQQTENKKIFKAQQTQKERLLEENQRLIEEIRAKLQQARSLVLSQQFENQGQVEENKALSEDNKRLKNEIKALISANQSRLSEVISLVTSLKPKITAICHKWNSCQDIGNRNRCVFRSPPLKDNTGDYAHYFLNREQAVFEQKPFYHGQQGCLFARSCYPMGELFFALNKQGSRVQLGKYNGNCWTEISGWVDKKNLIEGLRPLTVGQAAKQFPQLTEEPGVKPGSTLWLRVLQKPEYYRQQPLTAPNPRKAAKVGLEGLAYRWRYVYAIESVREQLWYLVGSQSRLFYSPRKNTAFSQSQKVLLGWIPAKANLILATNLALELNTIKAAVDERVYQNKPVILYEKPRTNSQQVAKEALEMWDDYKRGQKTAATLAWIEPEGLDPSYPRFYVHGFNKSTGWYHVSTWGSVGDTLKPSEITRLARQLQATLNRLRTVDIVVVFDRSASRSDELKALKSWLIEFSKDLARNNARKTVKLNFLGQQEQFTIGLKINFSLVLFEGKQDYPIFKRVKLPQELAQAINGINRITLEGGYETVFDTLTRVVPTHSGYWEDGGFSQRVILLMADEPGDVGNYREHDVKRALPLPREVLTQMGYNPNQIPATEWTKIWGIYTGDDVATFRRNVDTFIPSRRLRHIPDFENTPNQTERFKREMIHVLNELQQEIEGRAKRLGTLLVQEHQAKQQGKQRKANVNIPALMILQDAAIQAALKEAGISLAELSTSLGVAFVDGYIPLYDQGRQHPSVQEVVVLEKYELKQLEKSVFGMASNLKRSFSGTKNTLANILNLPSRSNRREKIAAILLYAILATTGDSATLNALTKISQENPNRLIRIIRQWMEKEQDRSIAAILGMQAFIETNSKGLLNRPLKDILGTDKKKGMDNDEIHDEAHILLDKSHCMDKILDGRSIPLDVKNCKYDKGIDKRWKYEQGNENYIYVPMRVMP